MSKQSKQTEQLLKEVKKWVISQQSAITITKIQLQFGIGFVEAQLLYERLIEWNVEELGMIIRKRMFGIHMKN